MAFGAEYQWTRVLGTENLAESFGIHSQRLLRARRRYHPQVLTVNYSYVLPFGGGQLLLAAPVGSGQDRQWLADLRYHSFQNGQPFSVTYTAPAPTPMPAATTGRTLPAAAQIASRAWRSTRRQDENAVVQSGGLYRADERRRDPGWRLWKLRLRHAARTALSGLGHEPGEEHRVEGALQASSLRADSFNIFNHPNFNTPNANISNTSTVGTITSISSTPTYEARTVEFAAKFNF